MTKILILACFVFTQIAWAQTGPYARTSHAHFGQKLVTLIDNSTVGAIQTTIGAAHIIMFAILNPINGRGFVKLDMHNNKTSEASQIVIDNKIPWFSGAYSLGLFQVGGAHQDHEGGHAIQSAALGPLYLPAIGLSYMLEGYQNSLFEEWADLEMKAKEYGLTGDIKVGMGGIQRGHEKLNVLVIQASLDQTQYQTTRRNDLVVHKSLHWLNSTIMAPLVTQMNPSGEQPLLIEIDLLKKNINVIANNQELYLGADQSLRTVIQTEQKYLHLGHHQLLNQAHFQILSWSTEFGFQYNLANKLKVTPKAGVKASLDFFGEKPLYKDFLISNNYQFSPSVGVNYGVEIELFEYLKWENEWAVNWYTNGNKHQSFYTGISNEFRNPMKKIGFIQYVEIDAGYQREKMSFGNSGAQINMSHWRFGIGLRF
jgi:hypothetical protein